MSATLITGDADWASVRLLMRFQGAHGSNSFVDETGKTIALLGSPTMDAEKRKFGESSVRFKGGTTGGDGLKVGAAADWKFLHDGASWSLEAWLRFKDFAATRYLMDTTEGGTTNSGMFIGITTARNLQIQITRSVSSSWVINADYAAAFPNDDYFHHLLITYDSAPATDVLTAYVDGSSLGSANAQNANNNVNPPQELYLGRFNNAASTSWLGNWAAMRITEGVIRPSTVPTARFPGQFLARYADTITESLTPTDWIVLIIRADTGEVVGSQSTNTGSYSIDVDYTGPCYIACRPDHGGVWAANTAAALDDLVFATDTITTPHYWKCTTPGTTGGTEPTWNLSGTTADGSAVWTYVGTLVRPLMHGPIVPA